MRFWDSSALLPLLVEEPSTDAMVRRLESDAVVAVWWTTPVECGSALARLERDGDLTAAAARTAFARLDRLAASWFHVEPIDEVRDVARRLLRVHPLRAAAALQLAAAFVVAERRPSTLTVVTLDDRIAAAGLKEGFDVEPAD